MVRSGPPFRNPVGWGPRTAAAVSACVQALPLSVRYIPGLPAGDCDWRPEGWLATGKMQLPNRAVHARAAARARPRPPRRAEQQAGACCNPALLLLLGLRPVPRHLPPPAAFHQIPRGQYLQATAQSCRL